MRVRAAAGGKRAAGSCARAGARARGIAPIHEFLGPRPAKHSPARGGTPQFARAIPPPCPAGPVHSNGGAEGVRYASCLVFFQR